MDPIKIQCWMHVARCGRIFAAQPGTDSTVEKSFEIITLIVRALLPPNRTVGILPGLKRLTHLNRLNIHPPSLCFEKISGWLCFSQPRCHISKFDRVLISKADERSHNRAKHQSHQIAVSSIIANTRPAILGNRIQARIGGCRDPTTMKSINAA
ncbi:hypothetical protein QCA50_015334 [Cerrena zonata]|uniref:Uncharacterized protein n=1 Tax=Cerrena zonata TaxID=2478898 RepID=A0AAW0FW72_9APHY